MLIHKKIAPHETFELHELITFKNVCATKASAMSVLVKDELKELMQLDLENSQNHIKELSDLIQASEFMDEEPIDESKLM